MKKTIVIHPFLFAVFPILFLFSFNKYLLRISVVIEPIIVVLCFTLLSWLILNFAFKNKMKSALVVSLFLLLFFSYGHVLNVIQDFYTLLYGYVINCRISALIALVLLFFLGIIFTIKTRRNLHNLTSALNIVAASLVLISLIDIGIFELKRTRVVCQNRDLEHGEPKSIDLENLSSFPNIYYIILDGYARADVLEDLYHYDNSKFLDYLKNKGFYVASKSRANYAQTFLSLVASLNLKYLHKLIEQMGVNSDDRMPLIDMIEDNEVVRMLKDFGYTFVLLDDWIAELEGGLEMKNIDFHVTLKKGNFEDFLIRTTPFSLLLKMDRNPYERHRERLLYNFDRLTDACYFNPPIFVFTHILMPHPPFVFGKDGEAVNPDRGFIYSDPFISRGENVDEYLKNYKMNYIRQLNFLNKKLQNVIEEILSHSLNPPIIILQADHGPATTLVDKWRIKDDRDFKERMCIFNAYYLPDSGYVHLYADITPVNTFRVIFNHYFGMNYELLEDRSYFSTWFEPYILTDVTNKIEY